MTAVSEVNCNLKEALVETLNNVLSADSGIRRQAEEHIKVLEVTEEFGVYLLELSLDRNGSLSIRQLAAVLLQKYVETHWYTGSHKFRLPECPEMSKRKIRDLLAHSLYEPISKVRSCLAYVISSIGSWDFPEEWPQFFQIVLDALQSKDDFATRGAMRVLTEFSRDVDDSVVTKVAPIILPEMFNIFSQDDVYNVRIRGRAIEIYANAANAISMIGEYNKSMAKRLLYPSLSPFTQSMLRVLETPDGPKADCGLKKDVLKALTTLVTNVPRQMGEFLPDILSFVWRALTSSAHTYLSTTVNAREEARNPTDSDGEVLGFDNLVYSLFEFVDALLRSTKHRELVKQGVPDLIYYLILYMQLTEEQIETFNTNANAYVEFEDDDSFTYSVRSSATDLLRTLQQDMPREFCHGLVSALDRHVAEAERCQASGDATWWKVYEAVLAAVAISADALMRELFHGRLTFDLTNFIEVVIKKSLHSAWPPYLSGKALYCGAELSLALDGVYLSTLLHVCTTALQPTAPPVIRINAIWSVTGLCEVFNGNKQAWVSRELHISPSLTAAPPIFAFNAPLDLLQPYMPGIVEGLVLATAQSPSEVMALSLERLTLLMALDPSLSTPHLNRVSSLCLAVFIKTSHDTVLVSQVQDLLQELCQHPASDNALQAKFFPTLVSLLNADPDKVPPGVHSVTLDMLSVLVRSCPHPGKDSLLLETSLPAVVNRILRTDDLSTQQNGGECLRAYIAVAADQVVSWRDAEGRSGLQYVLEVCHALLSPGAPDGAAAFVGRLVTALLRHAGQHLRGELHRLLRGVLSKLQSTDTLLVVQNLLAVFAQLIHSELEEVLSFLSSVPGPEGDSALSFVLSTWCGKQHCFHGRYERKVTVLALAKLLEHGVMQGDPRLQGLTVQGDQIVSSERGIRTRSQAVSRPEHWTQVPLLVKLFKLLIYELSHVMEVNMTKDDSQDDDDEEEGWEDEGSCAEDDDEPGVLASDVLGDADLVDVADDEEDDPDAVSDPLYKVDLQPYLTGFIRTFRQHPAYSAFSPHLNPHEKEVLTAIGVPMS